MFIKNKKLILILSVGVLALPSTSKANYLKNFFEPKMYKGYEVTENDVNFAMMIADKNGDGKVSVEEANRIALFVYGMVGEKYSSKISQENLSKEVRRGFKKYDINGDGYLSEYDKRAYFVNKNGGI